MAANKNPRKSYKTLFLNEYKRRVNAESILYHTRQRLKDINGVLEPIGLAHLEAQHGTGPIEMSPFHFIASRAYLESGTPFMTAIDQYQGWNVFQWRDRPIIRRME